MNESLLTQLGLSEKEIAVYKVILQEGKIAPAEIAKRTKIKRPTVYMVADELLKKGIIAQDLASEKEYLLARDPKDLKNILIEEESALKKKKDLLASAIEEVAQFAKAPKYHIPKISFIGQDQLERYLYTQTPIWNESMRETKTMYWGFQDRTFPEENAEWIDWYWKNPDSKDIVLQLLTNASEFEENVMQKRGYDRRKLKYWNANKEFSTTIWINGNYTIIINTRAKPFHLIDIYDPAIAESLRELFKGMWEEVE